MSAMPRPHRDQDARWPFPWHDESVWDRETLSDVKQAIALRHAHPALRRGTFTQVYAKDQQFAFLRADDHETLLVAFNSGDDSSDVSIELPDSQPGKTTPENLFGNGSAAWSDHGRITISIPARSAQVVGV